jgi:signal transduction histidine kinase
MLRDYIPNKKEIHIQRLFDDISQTVKTPMEDAGIKFRCNSKVDTLYGQEDLIKSLILNLCLNAIKACAANNGIISVEAINESGGVALSVSDNGCGIPTESLAKVTEPFYRVDKARNRKDGGAGLGLALCRRIAETHGAEMLIESEVGTGTTVKITFTTS